MKIGFGQWRKEAPKEIQGIAGVLLAEGAAIGSFGLAANVSWAGYAGLGCVIVGTLLEKLSGLSAPPIDNTITKTQTTVSDIDPITPPKG